MQRDHSTTLLGETGQPLDPRIARALIALMPRFRRNFLALVDDAVVTDLLEKAGRRLEAREHRSGPLVRLHGYAWVTLRSVALSELRRGALRVAQRTVESRSGLSRLATLPARFGRPEDVERATLLRELLAILSPEERLICVWKKAGFSSREIAKRQGRSPGAIDTLFSRAKAKLRRAVSVSTATGSAGRHEPSQSISPGRGHDQEQGVR